MPAPIRITADTTKIKKSILEIGKDLANLGTKAKPVSILSKEEQEFTKRTVKDLGKTFGENRKEISKLIGEHSKLLAGSKEYRNTQKEITKQLREQKRLAKEIQRSGGSIGGGGTGGGKPPGALEGLFTGAGKGGDIAKIIALTAGALGISQLISSTNYYKSSVPDRIRLQGMGVREINQRRGAPFTQEFASQELANVGLTENDAIAQQVQDVSVAGRKAGSNSSVLKRAALEYGNGLERGKLGGVLASLSPTLGGDAANTATNKAVATLIAGGVGDALSPALDSVVDLLTEANDQGISQVNAMLRVFMASSQTGGNTPAQLARMFGGLDEAIKQSGGERNAFFQSAFGNAGIGGGTIGATQLAISSGGLFGLDPIALGGKDGKGGKGYSNNQISMLRGLGMFQGIDKRGPALLSEAKRSAGISNSRSLSSIDNPEQFVGLNSFFNGMFGTQGMGGFTSALAVERAGKDGTSKADLEAELKNIARKYESEDTKILRSIKASTSGSLKALEIMRDNASVRLGEQGGRILGQLYRVQTAAIEAETVIVTGVISGAKDLSEADLAPKTVFRAELDTAVAIGKGLGSLPEKIYDGMGRIQNTFSGKPNAAKEGFEEQYKSSGVVDRDVVGVLQKWADDFWRHESERENNNMRQPAPLPPDPVNTNTH